MRLTLPTCVFLALALSAPAAEADEQRVIRRAVASGQIKPLSEILAAVEVNHPGKVLDVDLERDLRGRRVYEITILKAGGQRSKVLVDATSGHEVRPGAEAQARLPVPALLRKLLARHPGQVLDLELKSVGESRLIYEIQLIQPDGRLRELAVDAQTGEPVGAEGHRRDVLSRLKPLPEILDRLPARYRGDTQEIELEFDQNGRYFYEIEIRLSDGRIIELDVDAITGEILNDEEPVR